MGIQGEIMKPFGFTLRKGRIADKSTYLVIWSGGYESPSYKAHASREEAIKTAEDWWADADEDSDWIDVLEIKPDMTVDRLEVHNSAVG